MSEMKRVLWDAERLAKFSNARDLAEVNRFRTRNEDFLPPYFWELVYIPRTPDESLPLDSAPTDEPGSWFWQQFQHFLRAAWLMPPFSLDACVQLISCGVDSHEDAAPDKRLVVWPYQRAVMFLGTESWRARFCQCGQRFAADKPARRFCSNTCSAKARKASRAVSWGKHGDKWRARYESKKAKGKSSKRTKR